MSRIEKLDPAQWDPELRELAQADTATPLELGLLRMMAHSPDMAKGVVHFISAVRQHRTLPDRLVELVRLRVAFHNQCRSCMAIRYRDAMDAGCSEELVCELADPPTASKLSAAEKAAIAYGEMMATDHLAVDDAVYETLRQHFSEAEIVELGITVALFVGFGRLGATWHMVEELPAVYQQSTAPVAPWDAASIVVR